MIAILQSLVDVVLAAKLELLIFFVAIFVHFALFSKRLPQKAAKSKRVIETAVVEAKDTKFCSSPDVTAALLRELRPLVQSGAKALDMENAIRNALATQKVSPASAGPDLASVLESHRSPEVELLAAVRKFLIPEPGYAKVAEQLLQGYMGLRLRDEFYQLLTELDASYQSLGECLPSGVATLALQSALADKNFEVATKRLADVAPAWGNHSQLKNKEHKMMQQLTSLAAELGAVPALLETMQSCGLCKAPIVEPILMEAAHREDRGLIDKVERFAKDQNLLLSPASRCSILLGLLASRSSDEEFLNYYESNLKDVDVLTVNTKAGRAVADAALRLNRNDLLAKLLRDCEDARRVGLLRSLGKEGKLEEAKRLLEACPSKSTCLHNALLDATVGFGDPKVLETAILEAENAGVVDVVTYNTVIKGHLQRGDVASARRVFKAMRASGLKPSVVTFNELLDASNGACWSLIDEMKFCEIKPNKVTCSILLKCLKTSSSPKDVERTMGVLGETSDDMDEVLLSSVCEACIRTNRSDILAQQLKKQRGPKAVQVQGAHTFGSLIRGYGFINDLQGVWATWRGMRSRHILPTSITLGCMIEALVSNDDIEAAYELVHEIAADERTQGLVNSVIYGSLLKGFCRQKRFVRVWTIYEEMLTGKMNFSIVTYNSLIDACARSGEMHRVQPLLEDMTRNGLSPNVITYSTVIKGYCSANRLDEAFALLQDMKRGSQLPPDEVTYNTLLDGCARYGLYDRGMSVLKEMCEAGVPPSNFTLSVLVKLATRAKQPAKAFELCDSICKEYGLHPNVHVYNNLIQAATWCTKGSVRSSGAGISNLGSDLTTALQTVERMFVEKVRPDARTYTLLLKCCVAAKQPEHALQLLRTASGLGGSHPRLQDFASTAPLRGGPGALPQDLLIEVLDFASSHGHAPAAASLVQELSKLPGAKISNKICQQYTARAIQAR